MAQHGVARSGNDEHAAESPRVLYPDVHPLPRRGVPSRQTSFIGRTVELAELAALLSAPDYRLLTIIGPGGIGKTRLALEAADAARSLFVDGVAFVSLQSVSATETFVSELAVAIGCTLRGHGSIHDQVARFLHPLRMLLVLDNVEHLLDEASWLAELLAEAPGLRILVTSREALNLREEWRYPLAGLRVPDDEGDDPGASDAVRLFVERARQVRHDFSLEAELGGVIRLCRITEGLPLALELAAAWIKTLSCTAIADEIERNIRFLATSLRNVPARHRSVQAAFDHSWVLLTEDERRVFQQLAVFRGGFRRGAAEQVAGATLPLLSSLVDKSLLRYEPNGRFHVHELLRQYADEHLHSDPGEAARTYAAHRDYYVAYVGSRFEQMTGGRQIEATEEIADELSNIQEAWRAAVVAGDGHALDQIAHPLTLFCDFRGRYREGLAMLEEGLRVLRAAEPSQLADQMIASMLVNAARLHIRLGQLPEMRAVLTESMERSAHLDVSPAPGQMTDPQLWLGILALLDGQYDEAARLGAEAVQRNTANARSGNVALAWSLQAVAALWQEDTDAAEEYAERATSAAIAVEDRWYLAYARNQQGHVATARGDYAEARHYYDIAYGIREEFGDPEGVAVGLGHMAKIAALQGDWVEAEALYRRHLAIARDIGDQGGLAQALNGLGLTACATGNFAEAGRHFAEGLRLVVEVRYVRLILTLIVSAGDWLLQTGRHEEAVEPLSLALSHPASDHETRARTRQLLAAAAAVLPPEAYEAAIERSRGVDPGDLAPLLIPVLTAPLPADFTPSTGSVTGSGATPPSPTSEQHRPAIAHVLAEPLTTRELEVLRLIAAGHSNREIADELFLAVNTVRSYTQQIYGKLEVGSRTQAIARARDIGLLT